MENRMRIHKSSRSKGAWPALVLLISTLLPQSVPAASDDTILEAAKREHALTLWTSSDLRTATALVQRFESIYPFLKVNVFRTGTGALHNKITTEALAGQHNWDVMNTLMPTRELIDRKLLARYNSREAEMLADQGLRDPGGYWTAIYAIPYVMGYNTNLVKAQEAPKSYDDLLRAQWKGGKISIDQDGYELLQGLIHSWGKEKAVDYLTRLAAQQPVARRGNSLRVQLAAAGEHPLLITMASPLQLARRGGAPLNWIALEPVPVSFHAIAVAERAARPNAAKLYVDFVLSREGQETLRSVQRIPVRKDVDADPPALFKGYNRTMLQPVGREDFNEIVALYNRIFELR
jgi:iron(III) transport system substrate-binding protein